MRAGRGRTMLDSAGGVWELLRLGLMTGFRLRGPYWQWRLHTAFGRGRPAGRFAYQRALLEYGRWVHVMRRRHGC